MVKVTENGSCENAEKQMTSTTDSEKCGITTLFVMSCRGRAEAFARRLQNRLNSLNKEQEDQEEPNETTWLAASDQIAIVQPRHNKEVQERDVQSVCFMGKSEDVAVQPNLQRSQGLTNLKLSDVSSDESDEEVKTTSISVIDVSVSSSEYCTCLEDLSRTLTEDSFTSLESDVIKDDGDQENTKNEDDYNNTTNEDDQDNTKNKEDVCIPVIEENIKNEERNFSVSEENLFVGEIFFCDRNCDILKIHDGEKDRLPPPENSLNQTDLLNLLQTESSNIQNGGYQDEEITPLRRCSSLRSGKTPPGTPGRKKIVRFADVLGLDLADVRTFLDEIPKIPNSAYFDLQDANLTSSGYREPSEKILIPLFTQPGGLSDFLQKVRENKVCLENALVEDVALMSVKGTVRVLNLDFHKAVHIRYSVDGWKSFSDLQCSYVINSCDGFSDKFTFLLYANMLRVGERLEFAIRYQCKSSYYWDNNNRCNYSFQCLPTTSSMPYAPITSEEPWGTAFYYNEDDAAAEMDDRHRHLAVQEYIAATLDKHKKIDLPYLNRKKNKQPNIVAVFLIVLVSIVFLYVQRAVYFT